MLLEKIVVPEKLHWKEVEEAEWVKMKEIVEMMVFLLEMAAEKENLKCYLELWRKLRKTGTSCQKVRKKHRMHYIMVENKGSIIQIS